MKWLGMYIMFAACVMMFAALAAKDTELWIVSLGVWLAGLIIYGVAKVRGE